mmetsp:Transcript_24251/g.79053  ORF Transcript_24251/g.79053 Transcript_24251/m.79053 type:complete len:565 (-) Transcript_24251:1916-3610(-)
MNGVCLSPLSPTLLCWCVFSLSFSSPLSLLLSCGCCCRHSRASATAPASAARGPAAVPASGFAGAAAAAAAPNPAPALELREVVLAEGIDGRLHVLWALLLHLRKDGGGEHERRLEHLRNHDGCASLFERDAVVHVVRAAVRAHVRVVLLERPHRAVVGAGGVEGADGGFRLVCTDAVEHRIGAGVAEKDGEVHGAASCDAFAAHVERDKGDELLREELRDELSNAAKAGDDDVVLEVVHLALLGLERRDIRATPEALAEIPPAHGEPRRHRHAERHHERELVAERDGHDAVAHRLLERHKGKLAAGSEEGAGAHRGEHGETKDRAHHREHGELAKDERGDKAEDGDDVVHEEIEVDRHADRHEKEAEEEPAERRDVRLHLQRVLRLSDEEPGEEGAELHREPDLVRQQSEAEEDEQRRRGENLGVVLARDYAVERAQKDAPDGHNPDDGGARLEEGVAEGCEDTGDGGRARGRGRQEGHEHKDEHHGEVLQEQDRKGGAAVARAALATLLQHFEADGGRAEREPDASHRRARAGHAERSHRERGDDGGAKELSGAEAEDILGH